MLPTALEYLPNMSKELEINLYVKRDDCTALAFGGNKTRHLEFIMAKVLSGDYDCILSLPAQDSHFEHRMVNHIAYALVRGTKCGIVTYRTPSTLEEWIPNFHIQVEEHIDEKVDILRRNFVSQRDKLYFQEDMILDFHTNYLCSKVGAGYVESFRVERLFG